MTTHADLLTAVEGHAPAHFAESWDNIGWQIRGKHDRVTGVLCAVDATAEVVDEAVAGGANIVLAHHPLLFRPLRSVDADTRVGQIVIKAIQNDVSILTAHTNWDSARGGISWVLAETLGLEVKDPLVARDDDPKAGLGVIAESPRGLSSQDLAESIERSLQTKVITAVGTSGEHCRIALMGGSGSSEIERAARRGATLYITADVRYHEAQEAEALNLSLLVIDHGASERPGMNRLAELLNAELDVPVHKSGLPTSPWQPLY